MSTHRMSATAVPLHQIMSKDVVCARPELEVSRVVSLMIERHIGCLPIVDERRRPIGVITKLDLVEQLDAAMKLRATDAPLPQDLQACCADEVMMPLAFTLNEYATVAHAAAMMMSEDTHHVIVVDRDDHLAGVVSSRDLVRWLADTDGL
jgi:CBS domain-containing protein